MSRTRRLHLACDADSRRPPVRPGRVATVAEPVGILRWDARKDPS